MRILVVDDEPLVAQTLGLIFARQGFEVTTVHCADQALLSAARLAPDLLLTDIDMPGRDGVALMTEFSQLYPACPILVLTGFYAALGRVHDCAETLAQPVSIVTKPCQPTDLLRTAGKMLKSA